MALQRRNDSLSRTARAVCSAVVTTVQKPLHLRDTVTMADNTTSASLVQRKPNTDWFYARVRYQGKAVGFGRNHLSCDND